MMVVVVLRILCDDSPKMTCNSATYLPKTMMRTSIVDAVVVVTPYDAMDGGD